MCVLGYLTTSCWAQYMTHVQFNNGSLAGMHEPHQKIAPFPSSSVTRSKFNPFFSYTTTHSKTRTHYI